MQEHGRPKEPATVEPSEAATAVRQSSSHTRAASATRHISDGAVMPATSMKAELDEAPPSASFACKLKPRHGIVPEQASTAQSRHGKARIPRDLLAVHDNEELLNRPPVQNDQS